MSNLASPKKWYRILSLHNRLVQGELINKKTVAAQFSANEKAIQRDIEDLRIFFNDAEIIYDHAKKGYVLDRKSLKHLTEQEILVLAKVLLESRAFPKKEMETILKKLKGLCSPADNKTVTDFIQNELFHYIPVTTKKPLFSPIWDLSKAAVEQYKVEIEYMRTGDQKVVKRRVNPQSILFSEFYFYLLASIDGADFAFPTVYRLDRIINYKITDEKFRVEYNNRFKEGEFRQRVQFMQTGELIKIKFRFWGKSLQAVKDRLPNAVVIEENNDGYIITAEVFGEGIMMWLLSQAQYLEVLAPQSFREEVIATVRAMNSIYDNG